MNKSCFAGFILLSMIFINACSYSSTSTGNTIPQQPSSGISRGDIPPDFSITTIDGKQYTLSEFRNERPVLLYFWASWCPYCRQDLSIVKEIYPKYADKVKFIAIDIDTYENADLIRKYGEKTGLIGVDFAEADTKILSDYSITRTTTKYAIGKDGTILYKGSGVFTEQQWEVLLSGLASD